MAGLGDAEVTATLARVVALLGESTTARDGALSAAVAEATAREASWRRVWDYFNDAPAEPQRRVALVDVLREAASASPELLGRLDELLAAESPDLAALPSPRAASDTPLLPPPRDAAGDAEPSPQAPAGPTSTPVDAPLTANGTDAASGAPLPPVAGAAGAVAANGPRSPGRLAVLVRDHPVLLAVAGAGTLVVLLVVLGFALSSGHSTPRAGGTPSYSVPPPPTAAGSTSPASGSDTSGAPSSTASDTASGAGSGAGGSALNAAHLIVLAHCDTSGNLDVVGYDPNSFAVKSRQTIQLNSANTICKSGNPATVAYATTQVLDAKTSTFAVPDNYPTFLPNPSGTVAVTGDGTQGGGTLQTQPLHDGQPEQQITTTYSNTKRGDSSVLPGCQSVGWVSDTTLLCAPGRGASSQGLWLVDLGTPPATGGDGTALSITPLTLPTGLMTNETITDTLLAADDSSLLLVLSNSSGDLTVYTVALPSAATLASPPASGLALQPVPVPSAATKAAANAFAPVGYAQDPVFPISWKN